MRTFSKIINKANICKKIAKNLPISDYEIYTQIHFYEENKILSKIFNIDFKNTNEPLYMVNEYYSKNFNKIKEIEYFPITCQFQKFFLIKAIKKKIPLLFLEENETIITLFFKYKKILSAIENDLLKISKKVNNLENIKTKKFTLKNKFYILDDECDYEVYFENKIEQSLNFSKYIKGNFLMKKLEELFGNYFFIKDYYIWSILELNIHHLSCNK